MPQTIAQLFDLTGKGAIVTGGAMGIGEAIARRLAEAGASVMITNVNLKEARRRLSAATLPVLLMPRRP